RRHIPWRNTRSPRGQDDAGLGGQLGDRVRDLFMLVGNDAPLDLVALACEELGEQIAAPVVAHAVRDAVRDCEHGGLHAGSFVFSTRWTSSIRIALSTALAMS